MTSRVAIGHTLQFKAIEAQLHKGRLHHGFILSGEKGLGKATFARDIAAQIVDPNNAYASLLKAGNHPDILILERPPKEAPAEGEKIAKDAERKRSISVEQIREMKPKVLSRPSMSERRVVIIDAADDLERSAANALLKILEEPPQGTSFLLISHSADRLLPTIRSRCQMLRFHALERADVEKILHREMPQLSANEYDICLEQAEGKPGQAIAYASLDMGEIEHAMRNILEHGEEGNRNRVELMRQLSLKNAQARYEAFLRRVPQYIAANVKELPTSSMAQGVDIYMKATQLAGRALGLSLDKKAVVMEMAKLLSSVKAK